MRAHVALCGAVLGAWLAPPMPGVIAAAAVGVFLLLRRRRGSILLLVATLFVVAAASSTHATRSFDFPRAGEFDGWVTLIDDPKASGPVGVRVTVRAGRQRLVATGHGAVAGRLDDALAGERVRLVGTIRPVSMSDDRNLQRHIVGRITVAQVGESAPPAPVNSAANIVRRTLDDGVRSLSRDDRALFLGMVIGDDRGQGPVTADDFRAAGLGHLLVVSGQNVAFVLAVAMPVAGRLRPAGRAVVLLVLLGLFAIMTRFEPSVLRATAMAGIGIGSSALGRPTDGRGGLSWAIVGLVVIDPFLVSVVAFQLSAAATAGIVWFGAPLAQRLPGPAWLRVPVSTTVSAQLAVSPVLIAVFGPLPLASLPANVLAGPASGAVMIWGCTAGLAAGLCGGWVATALHWPTAGLLWWIGGVAGVAAAAPSATLGLGGLVVIGGAILLSLAVPRSGVGLAALLVSGGVCALAVVHAPVPFDGETVLGDGVVVLHHAGDSIVVLDDPGPARFVLERLREAGIRRPVLIVVRDGDRADADAVLALHQRFGPVPTAAPPLHRVPGGRTVEVGQVIQLASIQLEITEVAPRIEIAAAYS